MRFFRSFLVWSCLLGCATVTVGCASSDYDDLQRRYQLQQLETANVAHARDSAEAEVKAAKSSQAASEDRAANLRSALDAERANGQSLQQELARTQGRVAALEAQTQKLRDLVQSKAVPDKQLRAELLKELGAAPAAGGMPPTTLPAAAATHH